MRNKNKPNMNRRRFLRGAATSGGALLLQSLATGLPAKILLDPLSASAEELPVQDARMLIVSNSRQGDPVNANVPGTYDDPNIAHPTAGSMVETPMTLAGTPTSAAKPWADLPQNILDRSVFFHHATYTPVHGEMARVQRMMDQTEKNDMLISLIAREIAPVLGTVQSDPVSLGASGGELLSSEGRILGNVAPLSVRKALGGVEGPLKDLTSLRDAQIDRIYNLYRERGTHNQLAMLDAWVKSREDVRGISQELISRLDEIDGNDEVNQIRTAAVLAAMKIAPVISVHLNFGADNHSDNGLLNETNKHLTAIPTMQTLVEDLDQLKADGHLDNDVLVGSLNVFGRTLAKKGTAGRDHNSSHHCMVLIGNGLKGGIVGGVEPLGNDYGARAIDSLTGLAVDDGDIPYEESLGAAGKTLGYAMGVDAERLDTLVPPGKIVQSVFDSA